MDKCRCYIIDDEPLAIDVIATYLSKMEGYKLVGQSTDPLLAFSDIQELNVDLLFLDIEMPEINGIDLIKTLKTQPHVVLTTAYREYAVEGFELNALDYLVKPISFERFLKTLNRYEETIRKTTEPDSSSSYIIVRADRKQVKVEFNDILYIEGLKDYVKIVTAGNNILTKSSVGNFMDLLPAHQFIRIHKSYIANIAKITAYTNLDVEISNIELPIGRSYKDTVIDKLKG